MFLLLECCHSFLILKVTVYIYFYCYGKTYNKVLSNLITVHSIYLVLKYIYVPNIIVIACVFN